ncbi:MAG TPA: hypothetical protein VLH56_17340 [Dissulfurispiraceae bacterium]|nr:hypothetical protein [Dissulfurispiraceae bacterium]
MMQTYEPAGHGMIVCISGGNYVLTKDADAEIERLNTYIHQLRGALGYAVPGHIPENPDILNGIADALSKQNDKLHREANLNMAEICRLRGQVALLRSKIIKAGRK